MPSQTASTSKDEWRAQFRAYRRDLSAVAYAARSALICSRVLGLPAVATASMVHVYWPQSSAGEVDTRPLIGALRGQGVEVILPVVTSYDPAAPEMEHRRYTGRDALTPNRWGIPEPTDAEIVPTDALDAVIVPALGAARNGHRIGHGSGYYDAFLNGVDVPRIILVYDHCLVPAVPADSHDVPGTQVVTERQALHAAGDQA